MTDLAGTEPDPRPQIAEDGLRHALQRAVEAVNRVVLDKPEQIRLAFSALLARGHLLIEDLPGVGKTTLAQALAIVLGGSWQRIQFTSDMLPADILGVSLFHQREDRFEFRPGPVFANVVLADEINRATPRTQSALLEAMAEMQVTTDGETHPLPRPFFVIATQNPADLVGTYPLPDSQLDRFLLCISLGYPDPEEERRLLVQPDRRQMLDELEPLLTGQQVLELAGIAARIHVSEPVLDYVQALVAATRRHGALRVGLSPRATLALVAIARAHAFIAGRDFCLPEDIKTVFPALATHRLQSASGSDRNPESVVAEILEETPVS